MACRRTSWSRACGTISDLGHGLQAAYFALAGDGDCGATLQLADGRVVKRLPESNSRPYRSIFGEFRWSERGKARGKASGSRRRRWMPGWDCRRIGARICCGTGIRPWWWSIPTPRSTPYWGASWA